MISLMDEKKYKYNLHKGASASTHQFARELRHAETEAEKKLWSLLRNRKFKGKKFRRQHALADFILDFYCHECKLAVELDGSFHASEDQQLYDKARTSLLNKQGITIIRFWNRDVINEPGKVLEKIGEYLH